MICEAWSVVGVLLGCERKPAVVISGREFNAGGSSILAPIVSARQQSAAGDVLIESLPAGLPRDGRVRMLLFTVDNNTIDKKLGELPEQAGRELGERVFSALRLA